GFREAPPIPLGRFQIQAFDFFRISAVGLLLGVVVAALVAFWIRKNPATAAAFFRRVFSALSRKLGNAVYHRVHAFGEGLNTVKDFRSFLELSGLSLLLWIIIGFAYMSVAEAYSLHRLQRLRYAARLLLT